MPSIPQQPSYVYFTGKNLAGITDLTPYKKYEVLPVIHPDIHIVRYIRDDVGFKICILLNDNRCPHLNSRYKWQYVTPLYAPYDELTGMGSKRAYRRFRKLIRSKKRISIGSGAKKRG